MDDYNPYNPDGKKIPIYIKSLEEKAKIMSSKEKPKKISIKCSDNKNRPFLLKHEVFLFSFF